MPIYPEELNKKAELWLFEEKILYARIHGWDDPYWDLKKNIPKSNNIPKHKEMSSDTKLILGVITLVALIVLDIYIQKL